MILEGEYPPDARVRKESKALLASGHDVRVLTERPDEARPGDGDVVSRRTVRGADVVVHTDAGSLIEGVQGTYSSMAAGTYPRWARRIRDQIAGGADAIHVHDLRLARTALEVAETVPVVVDLHENFPEAVVQYRRRDTPVETLTSPTKVARRVLRPKRHWDERLAAALRSADHALAVVPEARDRYLDVGGASERVSVVSNTVDVEWFDDCVDRFPAPETEGFVLTYTGTLSGEHRGVDTAIRALAILRRSVPDATLRVVGGRSKVKGRLEELATALGVSDAIEFTGWVDEAAIPGHIAAADVGLVPHRATAHTNTTVPHKLFQYMAGAIPVLATETTAVARVVRDANAGVVVPPEDPDSLARAALALKDEETARRFGEKAREAVETTYGWQRDAERLRGVYDELEAAGS